MLDEAETKLPLSDTSVRAALLCVCCVDCLSEGESVKGTGLLPKLAAVCGLPLRLHAVLGREIELVGSADGVAGPLYGLDTGDLEAGGLCGIASLCKMLTRAGGLPGKDGGSDILEQRKMREQQSSMN